MALFGFQESLAYLYMEAQEIMILHLYRVRSDLPEYMTFRAKQLIDIYSDIEMSIYEHIWQGTIKAHTVDDVIESLECGSLDAEILLEESDIIEMLADENMLNGNYEDTDCTDGINYLLVTGLGIRQVAIDKAEPFQQLSFERLKALFADELIWK